MPLLDHFHPPVLNELPWESMTAFWAVKLATWLNRTLPHGEYRAFANVHLGPQVATDVAEVRRTEEGLTNGTGGGLATLTVPAPVATLPAVFAEEAEVQVSETYRTFRLLGVIELVSPANKKGPDERQAFVSKCEAYLRQGVGLVILDVVTERLANLHNQLMDRIGGTSPPRLPDRSLYAVGYHPVRRGAREEIDVWPYRLALAEPLPAVPLGLRRGPVVPLDLDGTYRETLTDAGYIGPT